MNDLVPVDFHGDAVWAAPPAHDRRHPLVSLRPIVERFGLSWSSQLKRVRRDDVLGSSVVIMTTETAGGAQETVCLPLSMPPGFLFGISAGSIPDPEVRERVLTYKRECHDVLYRHFFGRGAERQAREARSEMRDKLKAVQIAMQLSTRAAARNVWNELGLPNLPEGVEPPLRGKGREARSHAAALLNGSIDEDPRLVAVRRFVAERLELHDAGEISNAEMHQAYQLWAVANDAPQLVHNSFGLFTKRLRLRKSHRGDRRIYRDYRLKPVKPVTLQ